MPHVTSASVIRKITVNWEGSLFIHHSLGMVNRELLCELSGDPLLDIRHIPYEADTFTPDTSSRFYPLTKLPKTAHTNPDIHIRHKWPPDFERPACDKFILMQPWEYGSLPVDWIGAMRDTADEIWVYTRYLKTCYERSGIPASKIKVLPLGIDPLLFNPHAQPIDSIKATIGASYCFLYNGGVTPRKGTDILVNAFLNEFGANEPVCLLIKDSDIYGKGMAARIKDLSSRNDIARIIYLCENIPHEQLAGLYRSADCYVHPYRAEGYGLPIVEAMACGLPAIVTGGGACLDYVDPESGYFVKCSLETMKVKKVGDLDTVDYPFWLIPDTDHLQAVLRYVFSNQEKAQLRGLSAGNTIRTYHTWTHAAQSVAERMKTLLDTSSPLPETDEEKNAMIDQAVSCLKNGNNNEATSIFQKILLRFGENSLAYEGLGIAAFNRKNYEEACHLFAAAHRISPANADIVINWYETAKCVGIGKELVQPVQTALQHDNSNDELRAIAIELGIL